MQCDDPFYPEKNEEESPCIHSDMVRLTREGEEDNGGKKGKGQVKECV